MRKIREEVLVLWSGLASPLTSMAGISPDGTNRRNSTDYAASNPGSQTILSQRKLFGLALDNIFPFQLLADDFDEPLD